MISILESRRLFAFPVNFTMMLKTSFKFTTEMTDLNQLYREYVENKGRFSSTWRVELPKIVSAAKAVQ